MLIDRFLEPNGVVLPGGIRHDDVLAPIRERARSAEIFVLDPETAAMAANVSLSKPSSILGALAYARLPAPIVWIEVVNEDLRRAMAALGSPNEQAPDAKGRLVRSGFLLKEVNEHLFMLEYVSALEADNGQVAVDTAPVIATFFTGSDEPPAPMEALEPIDPGLNISGKMRAHLKLVGEDPIEAAAREDLANRLDFNIHPAVDPVIPKYVEMFGMAHTTSTILAQQREFARMFHLYLLPTLVLLSCRNAIEIEREDLSRLNRKREKSGKTPLVEHAFIRMRLSKRKMAVTAGSAERRRILKGSLVIGHFKLRRSGPFWWSYHTRLGGPPPGERRKPRIVSI